MINKGNTRHGHTSNGKRSKEYRAWKKMIDRCKYPSTAAFEKYGGRGIKVSEKWMKFSVFLFDMGLAPSQKHSLERIDNNLGYFAENCKWATHSEQMRNTSRTIKITFNGKTQCAKDWAKDLNLNYAALLQRMSKLGWSCEKALTTPIKPKRLKW